MWMARVPECRTRSAGGGQSSHATREPTTWTAKGATNDDPEAGRAVDGLLEKSLGVAFSHAADVLLLCKSFNLFLVEELQNVFKALTDSGMGHQTCSGDLTEDLKAQLHSDRAFVSQCLA